MMTNYKIFDLVYSEFRENFEVDEIVSVRLTTLIILKREFKNLKRTCKYFKMDSNDSIFKVILYSIYYTLLNNKDEFKFCQNSDKFLQVSGENVLNKLQLLKAKLMPWHF